MTLSTLMVNPSSCSSPSRSTVYSPILSDSIARPVLSARLLPSLHQIWHHHHHWTLTIIDHLPEVSHGWIHWTLCNDECLVLLVTLQRIQSSNTIYHLWRYIHWCWQHGYSQVALLWDSPSSGQLKGETGTKWFSLLNTAQHWLTW